VVAEAELALTEALMVPLVVLVEAVVYYFIGRIK
jgi:hypothetical protein